MHNLLTFISVYFILIPTSACLLTFRTYRLSAAMLFLFALGIITEQVMIYNYTFGEDVVLDVYCLFECAIFLWIVNHRRNHLSMNAFIKGLLFVALPLWIFSLYVFPYLKISLLNTNVKGSELYNSLYQVGISFIAATELLKMVESRKTLTDSPPFWIILGIFVYCFGTFFVMFFMRDGFARQIWYVHNSVNVLTYVVYTVGLLKAYQHRPRKESRIPQD